MGHFGPVIYIYMEGVVGKNGVTKKGVVQGLNPGLVERQRPLTIDRSRVRFPPKSKNFYHMLD